MSSRSFFLNQHEPCKVCEVAELQISHSQINTSHVAVTRFRPEEKGAKGGLVVNPRSHTARSGQARSRTLHELPSVRCGLAVSPGKQRVPHCEEWPGAAHSRRDQRYRFGHSPSASAFSLHLACSSSCSSCWCWVITVFCYYAAMARVPLAFSPSSCWRWVSGSSAALSC